MKIQMDVLVVLSACFLLVLRTVAQDETVTGCDGLPCSPGSVNTIPLTSMDEAVILTKCHAKCLNIARANNTLWPSLSLDYIESKRTCEDVGKILECRRSCVIRSTNKSINRKACRKECEKKCSLQITTNCQGSPCVYYYPEEPTCIIDCSWCRQGCNHVLPDLNDDDASPSDPTAPPKVVKKLKPLPQPPGLFNMGSYQVPQGVDSMQALNLSAFLIRVENHSNTYYYLQDKITSGMLDLSYFACQATNVSFAVVVPNSLSAFSPATNVCVHGGTRYPILSSNSLNYSFSLDSRENFTNNAVLNISWMKPEEAYLVDNYEIQLTTEDDNCKESSSNGGIYHNIRKQLTHFTIHAREPTTLPKFDCLYECTLLVFPHSSSSSPAMLTIYTDHGSVVPDMNLTCTLVADEHTGLISAQSVWSISEGNDLQIIVDSIGEYSVSYQLVSWKGDGTISSVSKMLVFEKINATKNISKIYYYTYNGIAPSTDPSRWLFIEITPLLATNSKFRHLPNKQLRRLQPVSVKPSPIESSSIMIIEFVTTFTSPIKIILNMTWDEPEKTYGIIENYQLRILRQNVKSGDLVTTAMEVTKTNEDMSIEPGQVVQEENAYVDENSLCLYVQVRAKNADLWGEWSDSVALVRYPDKYPNCSFPKTAAIKTNKPFLGLWIGLGVGSCVVLLLFILCIGVCTCLCRRHRMKVQIRRAFDGKAMQYFPENGYANPMFIAGGRSQRQRDSTLRVPLNRPCPADEVDEWEIPVEAVIVDTKFGEGCFGEVHKGVVRGPLPSTRSMKTNICVSVAIKMLKSRATGSERTDFLNEIETMKKVAQGNNPHVITFIGCATLQEPLCLITEFVKYGDLLSYLETIRKLISHKSRQKKLARIVADLTKGPEPYLEPHRHHQQQQLLLQQDEEELPILDAASASKGAGFGRDGGTMNNGVIPMPGSMYADLGGVEPVNLISFAYQIASGLEYLTSIDVVHRDLACRNILIDENKNLKISDFGMSRIVTGDDIYVKTTKGRLPWKWMAIESIMNREFTHASDVWSYGVTLWEISTLGGFPYPTTSNAELLDYLRKGNRLECPDNCSPEIYKVMMECWNEHPGNRRTFPELRSLFDAMLAEDNPYIQFENINMHKPYYNTGSRRNTRCEEEIIANLSSSDIDFEASSTSTVTLNEASVNERAYDNLTPLISPETQSCDREEQHKYSLPHGTNQYVETPTFKFARQDDVVIEEKDDRHSNFQREPPRSQREEMEGSEEVGVEINAAANSAHAVE